MNKKPTHTLNKATRLQSLSTSSFKSPYVNPNSCFSPSRRSPSTSSNLSWIRSRRIYIIFQSCKKFLERHRFLVKPKVDEMDGVAGATAMSTLELMPPFSLASTTPVSMSADALNVNPAVRIRDAMKTEKARLFLSVIGITFFHIIGCYTKKLLLVEALYGPDMHTFPPYSDFLGFVNSIAACLLALIYYAVSRKSIRPVAPIHTYVGIGCCFAVAIVGDLQLEERFNVGFANSLRSLVVICVLVFQWCILRSKVDRKLWMTVLTFTAACVVAFVPWAGKSPLAEAAKQGARPIGWFWSWSMSGFFLLLYVLGDGVSLTYQEKLYRDHHMHSADQMLYIFITVGLVNLIAWLVGKHLGVIAGFVVDHPIIILSLVLTALPVAAKLYLMSCMMRLCGALACSIVHQAMVVTIALVESSFILTWDSPFRWLGTIAVVAISVAFVGNMHSHQHALLPSGLQMAEGTPQTIKMSRSGLSSEHMSLLVDD